MRKVLVIVLLVLTAGLLAYYFLFSDHSFAGPDISEGVIEYDISYPKLDPNSMMVAGMPDKAFLRFKNNNTSNEMSGMMGLISISYITNHASKLIEQRLTLINKKYASNINAEDLKRLNESYIEKVTETGGTKEIAGYKCNEASVKLLDGTSVNVYFTDDIEIEDANWSNPYRAINGVLMDFTMERYGVSMHLTATSVKAEKCEDELFKLPADSSEYKLIEFAELEKILEELNP